MSTTKTTKKTAAETYQERRAEIQKQIDRLQGLLENHVGDEKLHWGHVGDLGYLQNELQSAIGFFNHEDA
jgi:hypothetical protein